MRKHTGLTHLRHFSQGANAQAFQSDVGGQAQGGIHNGGLGLLAFEHGAPILRHYGCAGTASFAVDNSVWHGLSTKYERSCYFAGIHSTVH
jgi:hypothetical protein